MHATAIQAKFRGVSCKRCGMPIRLSAAMLKREAALKGAGPSQRQELSSRVFQARCRRCHAEAIFTLVQIADFREREVRTVKQY